MRKCENCAHAYKRSKFDIKKYGSMAFRFECLKEEHSRYVTNDMSCEKWERRKS